MSEVQLRQTYRDKIYNYKPSWILRWGVTFFFIFLLIIILLSGFISYPDIVPATVEITTINPPANLVAHVNGKIEFVLRKEGELIYPNDAIVVLESSAKWEDIETAERNTFLLDSLVSDSTTVFPNPSFFKGNLELGDIQASYSDLLVIYNEFFRFFRSGLFETERKALKQKYKAQTTYLSQLSIKQQLLDKQFHLVRKNYQRDSILYAKEVIPENEFEQNLQNMLNFKSALSDMNISIINTTSSLQSLQSDLTESLLKHETEKQQLTVKLKQSVDVLQSRIEQWKQTYLIVSPLKGTTSFTTFWSKNQNVKAGEVVVSVVPADSMQIKARLQFPVKNSGKVKMGQQVTIKLQNYPYQEFGMLIGRLSSISKVPNNLLFSADITLDNELVTSYGKRLPKVQQLTGNAEILTDDLSLLMRFFNPIRAVFDHHIKK